MFFEDRKTVRECKNLNEQKVEIERRLEEFLDGVNEDGPFDGAVVVEALFALARGVERTESFKKGVCDGEKSALAYPEVTRQRHEARTETA